MKSIFGQRYLKWTTGRKSRFSFILLVILLSTILFATPAGAQPAISPTPLPGGQIGVSYSAGLLAFGGTPPYTNWTIISGALPSGLTLGPATGIISGYPTTAGTYSFSVTVTDSTPATSAQQPFFITIAEKPISFVTSLLPDATEGSTYRQSLSVSGGKTPYRFSVTGGALPSGLTLDTVNGIILGTPAKGSSGTHNFTISVTDDSTPALSAQQSFSIIIKKGFYDSDITVTSSLAAGETSVYIDGKQVERMRGGGTITESFAVGEKAVISVELLVPHPTNSGIRFRADIDKVTVTEASPDATFEYFTEYLIDLKTDPPQIASQANSNWYRQGTSLKSTAVAKVDGTAGTQYRFAYWLLPTGEKLIDADLSWPVSTTGKVVATYDTYYQLTVTSTYGKIEGNGWYKAGSAAKWSVTPPEALMSGLLGLLRGKLKPDSSSNTEVMDAPKTITVTWKPDYTTPGILISVIALLGIIIIVWFYRMLHPRAPRPVPVPPTPAPAPPTIVLMNGSQRPLLQTTRDELVEQFRHLLQKYEDEVKTVVKTEGLPEARPIPESQRLAAPRETAGALCNYSSRNLVRTVVGNWRKVEEKIVPPDEASGSKDVSIRTVWARDVYNEWEISACSLRRGHRGDHNINTTEGYSLQNTITEEVAYSPQQRTLPPKPHFTDNLAVVDVGPHQIIPSDQAAGGDAITPDEVIPPD